jgi:hypothetical protein
VAAQNFPKFSKILKVFQSATAICGLLSHVKKIASLMFVSFFLKFINDVFGFVSFLLYLVSFLLCLVSFRFLFYNHPCDNINTFKFNELFSSCNVIILKSLKIPKG